jgi:hypothetical protein
LNSGTVELTSVLYILSQINGLREADVALFLLHHAIRGTGARVSSYTALDQQST